MSAPKSTPEATPIIDSDALRIVLFGMPHAGKSSLLGALAQAAQTQTGVLNGRLIDTGKSLTELRRRLYEDDARETSQEIVPYPAVYEPEGGGRLPVVLVDCDGRVANELLNRRQSLEAESPEGTLAKAVQEADVLILVVDGSAPPAEMEADFAEFVRFLRFFEQCRGRRAEVGGLPVFLVLTKCDLLAESGDTIAGWMDRIEERKRQVGQRFHEFLEDDDGPMPFGSIDLQLWATAVKRPELAGTLARPREPYGVAELFRQCFAHAASFRERIARSSRRLLFTLAGSTGIVAAMVGLALTIIAHRPQDSPQELLTKVDIYRSREGTTPSARLREPLQPHISELTELKEEPQFQALPADMQAYIVGRLQELQEYRGYKDKLQQIRPPALARGERDLQEIETSLQDLALPAGRQSEWSQTEAALARQQQLEDIKRLRAAVSGLEDWYRRLTRRGEELWTFSDQKSSKGVPIPWSLWNDQVTNLFDQADLPPHRPSDRLPGSTSMSYGTAFRFDKVVEARSAWENVRQRLQRLRDLSAALGLAGKLSGRPALLDIPAGFTAEQARGRLQELEKTYPRFQQEFVLSSDLPEVVDEEIRRAARRSYENLMEAGRDAVARHLLDVSPDGRETPESWRRLRAWLAAPEDLQAWRVLAGVLLRLQRPGEAEPLTVLDRFARQDRFDLDLKHLTLEIPDEWKMRPAGKLTIHHRTGDETRPPLVYEIAGDGRQDPQRGVTVYGFRPTSGTALIYRPGDVLWADLPLRDNDKRDWLLTWARSRSQVYQFERLTRPPRLHRKEQDNAEGKIAEGVTLTAVPEQGVPPVPDLIPLLKPEKR